MKLINPIEKKASMNIETKKLSQNKSLDDKLLEDKNWFYYQVIPAAKAPVFKSFLYKYHLSLKIGQRVKIPFGRRQTTGFILEQIKDSSSLELPLIKIKSILEIDEAQPPIPAERLEWLQWMSAYYHYPLGSLLNLGFVSSSFKKPKESSKLKESKNSTQINKAFLKLTLEQEECVKNIPIDNSFQAHLLHGVTGSGKTEVYIRLIAQVLKTGGQALVLLPEIFLTPQIVKRLSHVFPDQIALWHSQVTKAQKKREVQALLEGNKNLLVGTRSALFCPLPKMSLILIDEEHDSSFKQEDSFRYQARDSALVLAQKKKIPIVLGSATPDFSSYQKALGSSYKLHELKTRAFHQKLPQVTVLDLKKERKKSPFFWMSDCLLEKMEKTLQEGKQTALFLNRRGQAKALLCSNCGYLVKCSNCDISLTLHQKDYLICHYCSYLEPKANRCRECQSGHWLEKGLGTQKVEEEIKKMFPQYKTLRADRDSISSQKELLSFIEKVEKEEIQILIGTQMLAKGLNFPSLHLVGLLLADMDFNFPDFRAEERGFQTLLQMAGRAGRADLGEVILQSFNPDEPKFHFLKSHDYKSFFLKSINSRETWGYPPFSKLCLLKIDSLNEKEGQAFAGELVKRIKKLSEGLVKINTSRSKAKIQILGPSIAPLMKIKNRYRFQILIKTQSHQLMSRLLDKTIQETPKKSFIQLKIDRDPYSML